MESQQQPACSSAQQGQSLTVQDALAAVKIEVVEASLQELRNSLSRSSVTIAESLAREPEGSPSHKRLRDLQYGAQQIDKVIKDLSFLKQWVEQTEPKGVPSTPSACPPGKKPDQCVHQ